MPVNNKRRDSVGSIALIKNEHLSNKKALFLQRCMAIIGPSATQRSFLVQ